MFALRTLLLRFSPLAASQARVLRSRKRRSHALVSVWCGLILIAASQLVLGWAIDTERLPLRDPLYFDKVALFRKHPAFFAAPSPDKPTTLLFVGSSRTLNAIDARAANGYLTQQLGRPVETFNFGQAGAGPITNAVYIRRLKQDGVKPDFVLIEVHPVFLAGQHTVMPEQRWLLPLRLRREEMATVHAMNFPAATPAVHGPRGYFAPWNEFRFLIVDRYAPFMVMNDSRLNGGHEPDSHGFARLQEYTLPQDRAGLLNTGRGQYAAYFHGFRPTGCGVNGVRDMIEQCRVEGWKTGLILMPESSEWLSWYDAAGLKELDALMAKLSAEYAVPVFDARTWVPDHLSLDGHHLSGPGADFFTEKLSREALAPWMAK